MNRTYSWIVTLLLVCLLDSIEGRVALCITGSVRTFTFKAVHESIKSALVGKSIDVFFFLNTWSPAFKDKNDVSCRNTENKSVLEVIASFNPVYVELLP